MIYPDPLYAIITDFETYFKEVDTDARTCYRKAKKLGCKVKKVGVVTGEIYQDILNIYTSKPERQGRMVNYVYHLPEVKDWDIREGWPHTNYPYNDCDKHYFDFYGCFLNDKMIAFLELLHSNEMSSTYATMGHADYLKDGVMKFMFLEVIRLGVIKYLHYGDKKNVSMKYFFSDLGITHDDKNFLYNLSTYG